MNFIDSGPWI